MTSAATKIKGTKEIAQRIVNATNNFAGVISEISGCDADTAHRVTALYLKHKLAKLDPIIGRIMVKHGAYLEPAAVRNAIAMLA